MRSQDHEGEHTRLIRGSALRKLACLVLALMILLSAGQPVAFAAVETGAQQRLVHVGFFRLGGYHNMSSSGEKSGYGYEFLQMISGYANFKYIYVGYQKSWADMLRMLANGEIDMLTYAPKLPGYEKRFDFSKHNIGTSAALLTAQVSSAVFAAHDYQSFDGMRVGMLRTADRKAALDAYAAQRGISYTPVYYDDVESMQAALKSGKEIDAMVSEELRLLSDEVIIDKFDNRDLYVMVKKGNTQLLDTIDEAIRRLDAANPGWTTELQSKYFFSEYSAELPVTLSESRYIKGLVAQGKKLKVLFNPARYPMCYIEKGKATGVLVEIFKQIAAEYGLPYEFIRADDIDGYNRLREQAEADIVLDFSHSTDEAEILGYRLTSPYTNSSCSVITARDFTGTPQTAALISGSSTFNNIAKKYNPRVRIINFNTFGACADAVKAGAADCAYVYSSTAQIFALQDNRDRIKTKQLSGQTIEFRLAINAKTDMLLYGLLNKATRNFSSAETENILNSYLLSARQNYTFLDYLANNPLMMMSASLLLLLVLASFILVQKKNAQKLTASNNALNESHAALEKALTAANAASAAKTKFLSQMSHDIRTPLNGIIGMTKIAGDNLQDPARAADALAKISRSSDHLLTLINDILDLSRIESGKMTMSSEPTDLRVMIGQCVDILNSSVSSRDLEVVAEIAPIENPFVLTDALHVRQVLINIISNAVKFTPDGGTITFRADCRPDPEGRRLLARFEVSDTGIGMSRDFQKHIYEAFTQADAYSARTQFRGSGLGMSIVRQFVDMLGGHIDIRSKLGNGTSVVVELPFEIDRDINAKETENPADSGAVQTSFAGVRILLAEDNEINMEIARVMLESLDITVDQADDGLLAVDKFKSSAIGAYQCILMDVMMPNMNGYEATRTIRALDRPDAATVPIIAMTANAFSEDVKAALDSGMNAHIAKPVDPEVLTKTLTAFLTQQPQDK